MKKVVWTGGSRSSSLLVGMLVWRESCPEAGLVVPLRRLQGRVKDLQLKDVPWGDLAEEDSEDCLRVEVSQDSCKFELFHIQVFLISSLTCS